MIARNGIKNCNKCKVDYPGTKEYFSGDKYSSDGLCRKCKKCDNQGNKKYRRDNPQQHREYWKRNIEAYRAYQRDYWRRVYSKSPERKISMAIGNGIRNSIKEPKAGRHWEDLVGYTLEDLMTHLESQFTKGMSWKNHGAWHIDHIRPISDFNFAKVEDQEFKQCWSLWNLQPLWAFDNHSKSNKCPAPPLPLLHLADSREEL